MNISFASTTPALLAGHKTVTRRHWADQTMLAIMHVMQDNALVNAYNKSPRSGGKPVARIRLTELSRQSLQFMPDSDYEAEGFAWLYEHHYIPKKDPWNIPTTAPRYSPEWFKEAQQTRMIFVIVRFQVEKILVPASPLQENLR